MFAKVVRGFHVKTRLQSGLSRQEAEMFYVASLGDTLDTARRASDTVVLYLQGGDEARAVDDLYGRLRKLGITGVTDIEVRPQRGQDLGQRIEMAFTEVDQPALVVGSDSPTLHASMLRRGLELLTCLPIATEAVLGPTSDGGFWGVGLRKSVPNLFNNIAWSTDRALSDTRERLNTFGLRTALIDPWTDVDTPGDLLVVARQIQTYRAQGDSSTGRFTERVLRAFRMLP